MTIIVGLKCAEGLVLASDSQMSKGPTRHWADKVAVSANGRFAYALAGDEATTQLLGAALRDLTFGGATADLQKITDTGVRILSDQYDRARKVLGPNVPPDHLPQAAAIVGAWTNTTPALFRLAPNGTVVESADGFVTAGSGEPLGDHAYAGLRRITARPLSLHQARMLAYRVIADAIHAAGPGLAIGGPIQMASVRKVRGLSEATLHPPDDPEIRDAVEAWMELEAERFLNHQPPG